MPAARHCRRSTRVVPVLALIVLLRAPAASAHEFWIEPGQFRPDAGAKVPLRLYVGQYFKGSSLPFLTDSFERFYYADARGSENFRGVLGDDPAATLTIRAPGRIWIVFRSTPYELTYDKPGEFDAFLLKEGIDHLVPPAQRGKLPVKEVYSRCAKSLLIAGAASGPAPDRAFGLPLELIAESDPSAGRSAEFRVILLHRGAALPGALLTAFHKEAPESRLEARTDASGRARLALDRPGVWLLNAVHLIPASRKSGAQWETLWASLTFELP